MLFNELKESLAAAIMVASRQGDRSAPDLGTPSEGPHRRPQDMEGRDDGSAKKGHEWRSLGGYGRLDRTCVPCDSRQ